MTILKGSWVRGASLGSLLLAACSSTPDYHLKGEKNSLLQTRVALMTSCPVSQATARLEGPISGVVDALIAPVIDVGLSTAGTALKNAAAEKTVTFAGHTSSRFYKTAPETQVPYQLLVNSDNGCLVVVHGYFADKPATGFETDHPLKGYEDDLHTLFGLADEPVYYFEGSLVYSKDQAGFRVRTELLYSNARMMDHKTSDRSYKMKFTFSKPTGDAGGKAFSIGEIDIGRLDREIAITAPPFVGYSTRIEEFQTGLGTGYMPLPALDTPVQTALAASASRVTTLDELVSNIRVKLIGLEIVKQDTLPQEVDATKVQEVLNSPQVKANLRNMREQLKQSVSSLDISIRDLSNFISSDMQKAQAALEEARAPQNGAAAKAARAVARLERLDTAKHELSVVTEKRLQASARIKVVEELLGLPPKLQKQIDQIAEEREMYQVAQPFTVKVEIEETRPKNGLLAFFSSVFDAADEDIAKALKEDLDPVTKKALVQAEIEEKAAARSAGDKARVEALTAVLKLEGHMIERTELEDDASASSRFTIEQNIRLATLDAQTKCRDARALGTAPVECTPY